MIVSKFVLFPQIQLLNFKFKSMKKVRIFLLAITVSGIAGGVFAFKVNLGARRSISMCTAAPVHGICPPNLECNPGYIVSKIVSSGGQMVCYTPIVPVGECNLCTILTQIKDEGDQ
jgi:hypothetical protein